MYIYVHTYVCIQNVQHLMSRVVNMYVYTKFSRAIKFMDFAVSLLSAKLQSSKKTVAYIFNPKK